MGKLILYPKVQSKVIDFSKSKNVTVPNQSMSLQEIIRRFTRKESLPIEKEGTYEDRFGDLEKLSRQDITVRLERAGEIKRWRSRIQDQIDQAEAARKILEQEENEKRIQGEVEKRLKDKPDKPVS